MAKAKRDKAEKPKKSKQKQRDMLLALSDQWRPAAESGDRSVAEAEAAGTEEAKALPSSPKLLKRVQKAAKRVIEAAARLDKVTAQLEKALAGEETKAKAPKRAKSDSETPDRAVSARGVRSEEGVD